MAAAHALASWTLEPLQLVPPILLAVAYFRRTRTLAKRGAPVPAWRRASFATAIALVVAALVSPLHELAEHELFSAHMVQHVLLGDLAPLALVVGLTGPVLRPLLAVRGVAALRVLAHPLVALPLWAVNLYAWHLVPLYEGALASAPVHALQHALFFGCGTLMWAAVVETLPGPEWFGTGAKLGYVVGVRLLETVLSNVFLWAGGAFYPTYARSGGALGLSPERDQATAGAIMMIEGSLVTVAALAWLFLRLAGEGELRQQLLERGLDARAVRRAVRYGRADDLSRGR